MSGGRALLPVPTYLGGVTQTVVAAAAKLGGCGIDGGEGYGLLGQEGGRGLDQGWRVSEGRAQAPLLAQDLLVGHGVDGVGEGEGWAAKKSREGDGRRGQGSIRPTLPGQRGPCSGIGTCFTSLRNHRWLPTACHLRPHLLRLALRHCPRTEPSHWPGGLQ